jgi:signal transduction histidine kinase
MPTTDDHIEQRSRVAAELRDGATQELTLARLQLDLLCAGLVGDPHLAASLVEVSDAVEDASRRLQCLLASLAGPPRLV